MICTRSIRCVHLLVAALLLAPLGTAFAGLFEDEEARRAILELRQQVDAVKRESDQKIKDELSRSTEAGIQFRRGLLELQTQLDVTRGELTQLRGQAEQLARDVSEMQRRQTDVMHNTDERLRKLEPIRVTVDGKEFLVEPVEKRDYEVGLGVFRKGDFANAQLIFVDFLNRYVQTGYRASALFWLGNAQYATKDYKEALANFRALIAVAPDHMRVPEATLAIANCQLELKELKAARKTLEEIVAKHPGTEAAAAAKDRLARFK